MSDRFNKKSVLTIPNAMSVLRLLLIPLYLWLYCKKELYGWALAVLVLSGITDMLDGRIARQFDQVSDVGKILDPIADKLTQAALIVSLAGRYPEIWLLFGLFAFKEIMMGVTALLVLVRTDTVNGAQWFGKVSTAVLEVSMGILIIFPHISVTAADALLILSAAVLTFAGVRYIICDLRLLRENARRGKAEQEKDDAA